MAFYQIVPLVSGGLYAQSEDGTWWYVMGGKASKVTTKNGALPYFDDGTMTPSLDGTAYVAADEGGLWRFSENAAERVTEGQPVSGISPPFTDQNKLFPLYISERRKRIQAEEEAKAADDRAEEAYYNANR